MNIYSIKGCNRETTQHISGDNIIVKYDYNAVGQITTVHHPNDKPPRMNMTSWNIS